MHELLLSCGLMLLAWHGLMCASLRADPYVHVPNTEGAATVSGLRHRALSVIFVGKSHNLDLLQM